MKPKRWAILLIGLALTTLTTGARFECNGDNDDCEVFCFDDD